MAGSGQVLAQVVAEAQASVADLAQLPAVVERMEPAGDQVQEPAESAAAELAEEPATASVGVGSAAIVHRQHAVFYP